MYIHTYIHTYCTYIHTYIHSDAKVRVLFESRPVSVLHARGELARRHEHFQPRVPLHLRQSHLTPRYVCALHVCIYMYVCMYILNMCENTLCMYTRTHMCQYECMYLYTTSFTQDDVCICYYIFVLIYVCM